MKLPALDLPENTSNRAAWLERQLVGLELRELIVSLKGIQERGPDDVRLSQILGDSMDSVLQQGLSSLDQDTLRELLRHPECLLELQERIFLDGKEYWDRVERSSKHQHQITAQGERLMTSISEPSKEPEEGAAADTPDTPETPATLPTIRIGRTEYILSGIAAVLLVGLISWLNQPTIPPGWGFDRPGALTQQMPTDAYLNHIADAANEWFDKRPETKEALEQRLKQFINGCQTLIDAEHAQLAEEDREWLRERCIVWKANLEAQLAELNSASHSLEAVREKSDETIEKLMQALRERAEQASA